MDGIITAAEFEVKKRDYEAKRTALAERQLELETSTRQIQRRIKECWELTDCVLATKCKCDLTNELLDTLVEKILVHHDNEHLLHLREKSAEKKAPTPAPVR